MRNARLFLGTSTGALWGGCVRPWLARAASEAWRAREPSVVLVPSRSFASWLKGKLIAEGIGCAGLRFWTPAECRDALRGRVGGVPAAAVREHLHLLLAMTAADLGDAPLCRSVSRDPSALMKAIDGLSTGGWDWKELGVPSAAPLVEAFASRLREAGWITVHEVDRRLLEQCPKRPPVIASLLVLGFDGAHWEHWTLLHAAVAASADSSIGLVGPRSRADQIDQYWIGSWEQQFGEATSAGEEEAEAARPFQALAERMENPQGARDPITAHAEVRLGRTTRAQAEAIVLQAVTYLAGGSCERLGILFPGYGALSRQVSEMLARRGVDHNDTLGFTAAADGQSDAWTRWLAFQRQPRLDTLLALVGGNPPDVEDVDVAHELTRAYTEVLVDDLGVLQAWLLASHDPRGVRAGTWLKEIKRLPEQGTVAEFVAFCRQEALAAGWKDIAGRIAAQGGEILSLGTSVVGRLVFLDWLGAAMADSLRQRHPDRSLPYARVHLVSYAQAEGQDWSHLILTDLNEGRWPPPHSSSPFLPDDAIAALNRRALRQGRQGEGHVCVEEGRGLILGPVERRALQQRQYYNLVEGCRSQLCLAASLATETEPGRALIPSDFLLHLYYMQSGTPLSQAEAESLQASTAEWVARSAAAGRPRPAACPAADLTARAFHARRDPTRPFGPFEFSLASPPEHEIVIPCRTWEHAIACPAIVWLERFPGVSYVRPGIDPDPWALTTGTWVHRWLGRAIVPHAGGALARFATAGQLRAGIARECERDRAWIARAYEAAGRRLPDWWISGWRQAVRVARQLADALDPAGAWRYVASEWTLPRHAAVPLPGGKSLRLRGRVDVLFATGPDLGKAQQAWIIDFKTGSQKALVASSFADKLPRGEGVQLALYALAVHAEGVSDTAITLLTPGAEAAPQVDIAAVQACGPFWEGLCRMQDSGIFGMRGELRPEYGRAADYPLATLAIDAAVLEVKWALTHPHLTEQVDGEA
jgi:hypothetical protein